MYQQIIDFVDVFPMHILQDNFIYRNNLYTRLIIIIIECFNSIFYTYKWSYYYLQTNIIYLLVSIILNFSCAYSAFKLFIVLQLR